MHDNLLGYVASGKVAAWTGEQQFWIWTWSVWVYNIVCMNTISMFTTTWNVDILYIMCNVQSSMSRKDTYDVTYYISLQCRMYYTYDIICFLDIRCRIRYVFLVWYDIVSTTTCTYDAVKTYDIHVQCRKSITSVSHLWCRTHYLTVTYDIVCPTYDIVVTNILHCTWHTTW
jgi:hypothetical protein